jgi:hypothetical protein
MQESQETAFDPRPEVEERLRSAVMRLRLLEDLFRLRVWAEHADVDFDFSEEAYEGLSEFCEHAADDLSELAGQLPAGTLGLKLPELAAADPKTRAVARSKSAGRRSRRRRGSHR